MHELVGLGHSMMHAVVGLCRDETRTSEHIGISPAEEGWTVANDNEIYLVAALTCNVLQHRHATVGRPIKYRLRLAEALSSNLSPTQSQLPYLAVLYAAGRFHTANHESLQTY
jgi:hypothetical protein